MRPQARGFTAIQPAFYSSFSAREIAALRARIAELETMAINHQPEPPLLINLSLQILLMSIAFV